MIENDLWLCSDCLFVAVNGDYSGLQYYYSGGELDARIAGIDAGLDALGPHLVPDFDSEEGTGIREFSSQTCDCCRSKLAGERHRFAILGE